MKIIIINGPNLNLLGTRDPMMYGKRTFDDYFLDLEKNFPDIELETFQSNNEGEIIDKLHRVGFSYDGIVLNAGGYTHTSIAIADAILSINSPVVEVHVTNVFAREQFRRHSFMAPFCIGVIMGMGLNSYKLAIQALIDNNRLSLRD